MGVEFQIGNYFLSAQEACHSLILCFLLSLLIIQFQSHCSFEKTSFLSAYFYDIFFGFGFQLLHGDVPSYGFVCMIFFLWFFFWIYELMYSINFATFPPIISSSLASASFSFLSLGMLFTLLMYPVFVILFTSLISVFYSVYFFLICLLILILF